MAKQRLVGAAGIEPATVGLEIRCSIRLSYAPLGVEIILPAVGVIPNLLYQMHARKLGIRGKQMVGARGFEFWGRRSFNNIERTAGTVKQWKAVVAVLTDHKRITGRAHLKSANQGGHKTKP